MKFVVPALLLAAMVLAGCQSQAPMPVAQAPRSVGPARGIDLATDTSDVVNEMRGTRIDFVARYYRDPTSRWPALSPSEAQRLSALGYKIVTVWEWHSSNPAYFNYPTGYSDALSAVRQAKAVGQPPGSAIYFAVDFNARGAALYQVDQYFRGINAGLAAAGNGRPEYKVGVYGSGTVCAEMRGAGLAQYTWLSGSTAWDGTAGYGDWSIRQAAQGGRFPTLSFDHDANEARNDYGGFQLANYAGLSPPAAIVTAAAAVPAAAATAMTEAMTAIVPQPSPSSLPPQPAPPTPSPPALAAAPAPMAAPAMASVAPPPPAPPRPASVVAESIPSPPPGPFMAAATLSPPRASPPPAVDEPDRPRPSSRSAERPAREEPPHERAPARAAKELTAKEPAAKHKITPVGATSRAAAAPPRRPAGATLSPPREAQHKASAPRHAEEHAAHLQGKAGAVHVLDKPARRPAEPKRPEHPRHATDT